MDTPDKTTHPSPSSFLSKFEDSPVFNYISTLSPIKPFSVGHNTQPFHLFNFSSPQALQTPPTSYPKESKIPSTDVAYNNCSKNEDEGKNAATSVPTEAADLHSEEVDKINREVSVRASDESSKLASEFPRSFKYDCDAPENNMVHFGALKPRRVMNMAGTELFPVKAIQNNSKEANRSFENEMGVQAIQMEHSRGSDALNCCSPTKENCHDELDDRNGDSRVLSFVSTVLQSPNEHIIDPQTACPVKSEKCDMEVPLNTPGEIKSSNESIQLPASNPHAVLSEDVQYLRTEVDDKSCSQQQQATRRRCLVYEMSGSHYRKLLADSTGNSPSKLAANSNTSNDNNVMACRPVGNRFSSTLPSIGLHLNALAAASKDKIIVKRQTLTCRRQLINSRCTTPSLDSLVSDTKPLTSQITPEVVERELVKQKDGVPDEQKDGVPDEQKDGVPDKQNDGVQVSGNVSDNSLYGEGIEFIPSSPKKKRRKSENVGEPDSCKRCNCKRSKCLKLYCECFAAGLYCVEPCNCQDCFNKPIHEETVLETRRQIESRNPLAFAPKVIRCSGTPNRAEEVAKTPASARHKRGCNCKKSGCLKKYCECFQGGVGCSLSCRCEGCKNTFGRKEGTESIIFQEPQFLQMNAADGVSYEDEENCDQVAPDPSKNARQPLRRPFHFDGMTPHLPAHPSGSYIQSYTSQKINESDETAFEEDMKPEIQEVDAPESLKGDYSIPNTCVKSTSPNCKRISSPHYYFGTSPGWRSCRKVILRSVPCSNPEKESNSMELPGKL